MTTKLEQAARQLLDYWDLEDSGEAADRYMADLRDALAEPELNLNCKSVQKRLATVWGYVKAEQAEQDPVAWALTSENGEVLDCISHTYKVTQPCTVDYDEPLYAAPVRTKDLTDDEIEWLVVDTLETWNSKDTMKDFARAVIAKFKEKNK